MFVDSACRNSPDYAEFCAKIGIRGEFDAGQYKRIGKSGNEVWLQASYNPIVDLDWQAYQSSARVLSTSPEQHKAIDALQAAVEESQHVIEEEC